MFAKTNFQVICATTIPARSHDLSIVSLVKNAKCGVRMTFGIRSKTAMLSSVTQLLEKFLAAATLGSRSEQKQQNMGVSGGWEGMGKLVLRLEELSWLNCSHCSNHPVDVPKTLSSVLKKYGASFSTTSIAAPAMTPVFKPQLHDGEWPNSRVKLRAISFCFWQSDRESRLWCQ